MIKALVLPLCRGYLRFLRTDKERVGGVERCVRALLLLLPYGALLVLLRIRLALWGPLTVDGTTDDGIRLRCRLPDLIQMYVYLFGAWEPDVAAFLRHRLRPGDTFVDVGANIGCMTALAGRLVGPRGTVVAIEPCPAVIAALQETVASNDLTNVRLVAGAVSDRDHEVALFAGPSHNVGLTTTVARRGLREQGRVRAAPLGSLVTPEELASARLVKVDVEGAEDRVLAGVVAHLETLAADAELVVELSPTWWSDSRLRPIDVLRPYLDRGFHVYLLRPFLERFFYVHLPPNEYALWRYLWPRDIGAAQRLRDLAVLERRVARLDIVLSRVDADAL
jgi:FkbM family methyltransferase